MPTAAQPTQDGQVAREQNIRGVSQQLITLCFIYLLKYCI
jgi:hypothetical protein